MTDNERSAQISAQVSSEVRAKPNPWRWRRGENPYRYTAYNVLGLDEIPQARRAFRAWVERRVQRAQFGQLQLYGRRLEESDIHGAEQRLHDPAERVFEELRTHRPHPVRLDADDLARQLNELTGPAPAESGHIVLNRTVLAQLIPPPRARTFDPLPELP